MERVVVLGASPKSERYSNMAVRLLTEFGHDVVPVNPAFAEIEGLPVSKTLEQVNGDVDTVTLYMNPSRSEPLKEQVAALKPKRVIFNPGTESPALQAYFQSKGIETVEGCTLVMLRAGTF